MPTFKRTVSSNKQVNLSQFSWSAKMSWDHCLPVKESEMHKQTMGYARTPKECCKKMERSSSFEDGLLCRKAPTDEAMQIIVPECCGRTVLLYHGHCPTLAGYPEARKMLDIFIGIDYWPHKAFDVNRFGFKWEYCTNQRPSRKQHRWLRLFLIKKRSEFVAIDVPGSLKKTKKRRRFFTVIFDRKSKLTRSASVS